VADVLASACASCHGSPLAGGAPVRLLSYADLVAPSAANPAETYAQRSVARMSSAQSPMPPGAGVTMTAAQIAAFQAFIDAGYPKGECGAADAGAPPPDAAPPVDFPDDPPGCTSKLDWILGNSLGDLMNPGKACVECHKQKGEVLFAVAGTVYPTGHEPDLCIASGSNGAQVEITDANGQKTTLKVNLSGNFQAKSIAGFTPPYTAKVLHKGQERAMLAPQTNGDCNSCHTQDGANGAPGRIRLP
jgi:cytochrome c553